jgi:hypothetical protein
MPVAPTAVPVTACGPTLAAVQTAPVQEPFGLIANLVAAVRSPRGLSYRSRPCAV